MSSSHVKKSSKKTTARKAEDMPVATQETNAAAEAQDKESGDDHTVSGASNPDAVGTASAADVEGYTMQSAQNAAEERSAEMSEPPQEVQHPSRSPEEEGKPSDAQDKNRFAKVYTNNTPELDEAKDALTEKLKREEEEARSQK